MTHNQIQFFTLTLIFVTATFTLAREWSATSGHKLTGDFVELKDGNVAIKLPDGKIADVPLDKLSEADQEFVKQESEKKDNPFVIREAEKKDNPFVIQDVKSSPEKLPKNETTNQSSFGYGMTLETLQAEAEKNNPDALCWLGCAYSSGLNQCMINEDKMQECFTKASVLSSNNSASVLFSRGVCAFYGYNVEQNQQEAAKLFQQAAEQNYAPAQERWGVCLINQLGATENKTEGFEWIRKAAHQNFAPAQFSLGYCYAAGIGVDKDEQESFKWYLKAADNGDVAAQKHIGTAYLLGLSGLESNADTALNWFTKAAKQNDAEALDIVQRFDESEQEEAELAQAQSPIQELIEESPEFDEQTNRKEQLENTEQVRSEPRVQQRQQQNSSRQINPNNIRQGVQKGLQIYNVIRGFTR